MKTLTNSELEFARNQHDIRSGHYEKNEGSKTQETTYFLIVCNAIQSSLSPKEIAAVSALEKSGLTIEAYLLLLKRINTQLKKRHSLKPHDISLAGDISCQEDIQHYIKILSTLNKRIKKQYDFGNGESNQ